MTTTVKNQKATANEIDHGPTHATDYGATQVESTTEATVH